MSTIKFFKSQRGGEIINKNNYLYNKDRKINERLQDGVVENVHVQGRLF